MRQAKAAGQRLLAALRWFYLHEPAVSLAVIAAAVGAANTRWGLHLDAGQVAAWVAGMLGVGALTRQSVVSRASNARDLDTVVHVATLIAQQRRGQEGTRPAQGPLTPADRAELADVARNHQRP